MEMGNGISHLISWPPFDHMWWLSNYLATPDLFSDTLSHHPVWLHHGHHNWIHVDLSKLRLLPGSSNTVHGTSFHLFVQATIHESSLTLPCLSTYPTLIVNHTSVLVNSMFENIFELCPPFPCLLTEAWIYGQWYLTVSGQCLLFIENIFIISPFIYWNEFIYNIAQLTCNISKNLTVIWSITRKTYIKVICISICKYEEYLGQKTYQYCQIFAPV